MILVKKIIIVEDNCVDVELFKFCMDEFFVVVSIVYMVDGKVLIDYVEIILLNDIFFIFLDMYLLGMDGFEILDYFKEKGFFNGFLVLIILSLFG